MTGRASDPTDFETSETPVIGDEVTGTVFAAEDPATHVNRITSDSGRPRITARFAVFLTSNRAVTITFDGTALDPTEAELHRADYSLDEFAPDGKAAPVLRIIEWGTDPGRAIHLCDTTGAVLQTVSPDIHTPGFNYTAYLMWDDFSECSDSDLVMAELQAWPQVVASSSGRSSCDRPAKSAVPGHPDSRQSGCGF